MLDIDRALGRARNAAAAPQLGLPTWALQAAQRRCDRLVPWPCLPFTLLRS